MVEIKCYLTSAAATSDTAATSDFVSLSGELPSRLICTGALPTSEVLTTTAAMAADDSGEAADVRTPGSSSVCDDPTAVEIDRVALASAFDVTC